MAENNEVNARKFCEIVGAEYVKHTAFGVWYRERKMTGNSFLIWFGVHNIIADHIGGKRDYHEDDTESN